MTLPVVKPKQQPKMKAGDMRLRALTFKFDDDEPELTY